MVDDGSTDKSVEIAKRKGCTIISNNISRGRGYARMVGVMNTKTPFLLFCDSTNIIPNDFAEIAINQFCDTSVSACFGRILNEPNLTDTLSNWRARHLFGQNKPHNKNIHQVNCLITYAVLLKKEHILTVGNFNPSLKQCEDQELGEKLIKHNFKIISDPNLLTFSIRKETFKSICTRYARWQSNHSHSRNFALEFFNILKVCLFIFAREDMKERQYKCLLISLCLPFFLLFQNYLNAVKSFFKY